MILKGFIDELQKMAQSPAFETFYPESSPITNATDPVMGKSKTTLIKKRRPLTGLNNSRDMIPVEAPQDPGGSNSTVTGDTVGWSM